MSAIVHWEVDVAYYLFEKWWILDKKVNKMQEKGKTMVMVGYAKESPAGIYRMWNHVTNRIVSTDSVKWSNFASWEIKEEEKLSKIFEAAKAANQEGLETFDEMDMEHDNLECWMQDRMRDCTFRDWIMWDCLEPNG